MITVNNTFKIKTIIMIEYVILLEIMLKAKFDIDLYYYETAINEHIMDITT